MRKFSLSKLFERRTYIKQYYSRELWGLQQPPCILHVMCHCYVKIKNRTRTRASLLFFEPEIQKSHTPLLNKRHKVFSTINSLRFNCTSTSGEKASYPFVFWKANTLKIYKFTSPSFYLFIVFISSKISQLTFPLRWKILKVERLSFNGRDPLRPKIIGSREKSFLLSVYSTWTRALLRWLF